MLQDNRDAGEIPVDESLGRLLSHLRALGGVSQPAELDVETVRDVERALGWRLPGDVLAVFAAHLPYLEEKLALSLAKVIGHTGRARTLGAAGDRVSLGRLETGEFICLEKGALCTDSETTLLLFDPETKATSRVALRDWLDAVTQVLARDARDVEPESNAPRPPPVTVESKTTDRREFVPTLVRRLPAGSPKTQVVHKTFGVGRVLREIGTGPNRKVQVDFPGKGLKLLQARFLEWLE